jgi:hypothetical protein
LDWHNENKSRPLPIVRLDVELTIYSFYYPV